MQFIRVTFWLPLLMIIVGGAPLSSSAAGMPKAAMAVDEQGNLRVPTNYRKDFEFLGTWAIAADKEPGSKQMHNVYATRGTIDTYRKTGQFADGTVLVKEVYASTTSAMQTGTVSHAETLQGWFVMMKDSKNTHPGNALWGDGWGWSWFDAANPVKTTSTNYKTDCLGCHVPAKATDWIYINGYPPLRK